MNNLVKANMAKYYRNFEHQDVWHLTRRYEDIKSVFISKSIDTHKVKPRFVIYDVTDIKHVCYIFASLCYVSFKLFNGL